MRTTGQQTGPVTSEQRTDLTSDGRFTALRIPEGPQPPPASRGPEPLTAAVTFTVPDGQAATIRYTRIEQGGQARGQITDITATLRGLDSPGTGAVKATGRDGSGTQFEFRRDPSFNGQVEIEVAGRKTVFSTTEIGSPETTDRKQGPVRPGEPAARAETPAEERPKVPPPARISRPPTFTRHPEDGGVYAERIVAEVPRDIPFAATVTGTRADGTAISSRVAGSDRTDVYMDEKGAVALRRVQLENGNDRLIVGRYRGYSGDLAVTVGEQTTRFAVRPDSQPAAGAMRPPLTADGGVATRPQSAVAAEPAARSAGPVENTPRGGVGCEKTAHSVHLTGYMLPSPDQLGAGSCLYMSATGIAEFLLNKSLGIVRPQVGGRTDMSEQWTLALARQRTLGNNYTEAVELLVRGGYVRDAHLKFKAYADSAWMREAVPTVPTGAIQRDMPPVVKTVLFSAGGEGTQRRNGVMGQRDIDRIRSYLRERESPVLFVYQRPGVNWWHANVITGYDDKRGVFIMRDSAFGAEQSGLRPYDYGGTSPRGPQAYRGESTMSYQDAMNWGNHATGYALATPPPRAAPAAPPTPGPSAATAPGTSRAADLGSRPANPPPERIPPVRTATPTERGANGTQVVSAPPPAPAEPGPVAGRSGNGPVTVDLPVVRQVGTELQRLAATSPTLRDVVTRSVQAPHWSDDPGTVAHETAHGVSSEVRAAYERKPGYANTRTERLANRTGQSVVNNAVEGVYLGGDKAVMLKAPAGVSLQDVAATVPRSLRGERFDLYFNRPIRENGQAGFQTYLPTYIVNEHAAYNVGSRTALELHDSHYAPLAKKGNRTGATEGSGEFIAYALALGKTASGSGAYRSPADRQQLLATLGRLMEESADLYRAGKDTGRYPAFIHTQKDFLSAIATSPDAAPLREFAKATYGERWYSRVILGRS